MTFGSKTILNLRLKTLKQYALLKKIIKINVIVILYIYKQKEAKTLSQCVKLKFTKKKCAKFQNRRPRCDMRNSKQINLQLAEEKHNFPPESGSAARWRVLRGRSGRVRGCEFL